MNLGCGCGCGGTGGCGSTGGYGAAMMSAPTFVPSYGTPMAGTAARRVYAWLTGFQSSPWPETPRWAQQIPPDPVYPKFRPAWMGNNSPGLGAFDFSTIDWAKLAEASAELTAKGAKIGTELAAKKKKTTKTTAPEIAPEMPTPVYQPAIAPATGIPTWGWALIGLGVVAAGAGAFALGRRN